MWCDGLSELIQKIREKNHINLDYIEFALTFCLSYPITSVIPGMMNKNEVQSNLRSVSHSKLSNKLLNEILQIYSSSNYYIN